MTIAMPLHAKKEKFDAALGMSSCFCECNWFACVNAFGFCKFIQSLK